MECIDLKERFGKKYRILWEEPATSRWTDPWYMQIPCQYGHLYPHGGDELGFASDKSGAIARRVAALPFTTVSQDGSDGANVTFTVEYFDEIAKIVKPRRRRRLSPEHRASLEEARVRFRRDNPDWKPGEAISRHAQSDLERTQEPLGDSDHRDGVSGRIEPRKSAPNGSDRSAKSNGDQTQRLLF